MQPQFDDSSGAHQPFGFLDEIDFRSYLGTPRTFDDVAPPPKPGTMPFDPTQPPLLRLRDLIASPDFVPVLARAMDDADPAMRQLFPRDPSPVLRHFSRMLAHLCGAVQTTAGSQEKVVPVIEFARHLGADHSKLYLGAREFDGLYDQLLRTCMHLAGTAWTDELEHTLHTLYFNIAAEMMAGAEDEPGPHSVAATVVDVQRPLRDVAIVRLIAEDNLGYLPGQHLSVHTPYAPAVWRPLSPVNPDNPARQIEFHVKAVEGGTFSTPLVRSAAVGDRWVLAHPLGHLEVDRGHVDRDVLMIAGGTGVTPMIAIINDLLRFHENPRVHLFYGAQYPGELYALPLLVELAASAPWLTIQPVSESDTDPWWLAGSPPLPRTLHRRRTGKLVDIVTEYGNWADRAVLVSGSPDMVRGTVSGLVAAGTPRDSIVFDRPR